MKPLREAASKREARFANGRGNLFRLRFAATHGTCGFANGRGNLSPMLFRNIAPNELL